MAAPAATKEDAKVLVKQAVAYEKQFGRDKLLDEVRVTKGSFHFQEGVNKGLYIFVYDEKGVVLGHGARIELTGRNRWNDRDPDGKLMIQEFTNLVHKKASGWVAYREYNPADKNKIMNKVSFVELIDGMVIGCGTYE
jgi:signal transduction histidine kinase